MKDFFKYEKGELYWKIDRPGRIKAGMRFGCRNSDSYRGSFLGESKSVGEWVFKYFNGRFPVRLIFKDGDKFNCKIENLVEMTRAERESKEWCEFFFYYKSGKVFWRVGLKGVTPGSEAGTQNKKGYRIILADGRHILTHRVVWILHNGDIPKKYNIDHINGVKSDNRIENIRLATSQQNNRNRSGVAGACLVARTGKWQAAIQVGGKSIHLGTYVSKDDAMRARIEAEEKIFKEFSARKR